MPGSNQFKAIATGGGANALTPTAYAALATLLANGYQSGTASSAQINTTLRQATFVAAAVAQLMADVTGLAINDDGVIANFESQLATAMGMVGYGVDTGAANAYAVAFAPAELGPYDGLRLRFRALNANTGVCTLSVNGGAAKPIWNMQHVPLISGEIVANGEIEVVWNAALNSAAGAWVLLENTGGAAQLPANSYGALAAQFDSSNKLATAGFVQRALGNHKNAAQIGGSLTLSPVDAGGFYQITTAATITLPTVSAALAASGVKYKLFSNSTTWTLASGTANILAGNNTPASSVSIPSGLEVEVSTTDGTNWFVTGTGIMQRHGSFANLFGSNGYQKLPGSFLIQWGNFTVTSGGVVTVNYPIAFPNGVFIVPVSITGGSGPAPLTMVTGAYTNTQVTFWCTGSSNGTLTNGVSGNYIALGW